MTRPAPCRNLPCTLKFAHGPSTQTPPIQKEHKAQVLCTRARRELHWTPAPRSPGGVSRGPPGMTDAAHSKCAQIGANHPISSRSPEHTGPCGHPRPRPDQDDGSHHRVCYPAAKWSVAAARRDAVPAQIQACQSPARAHIPWPETQSQSTAYPAGIHADGTASVTKKKMLHAYLRSMHMISVGIHTMISLFPARWTHDTDET